MQSIQIQTQFSVESLTQLFNKLRIALAEEAAKLRQQAGSTALRSLTVQYHSDPKEHEQVKLSCARLRDEAHRLEGQADAYMTFRNRLYTKFANALSIEDLLDWFSQLVDALEKEYHGQAEAQALIAAGYSEAHPEYGCTRAAAMLAYGRLHTTRDVLEMATNLMREVLRNQTPQ